MCGKEDTDMKFGEKFRHGPIAIAVTALVILAILLVNAGVTALVKGNLLFIDLTGDSIYTVNSDTYDLLDQTFDSVRADRGDEELRVDIIFCADLDLLQRSELMRYVYYTARSFAKHYPDIIHVSTVDVWSNPSSVDDYRTNSYSSIYQTNVIIASGSEFRIHTLRSFYTFDSDTETEPWAYSGERIMTRSIIAVTRAEAPICAITTNHGEPFGDAYADADGNQKYATFLSVIEGAGYDIQFFDLEKEEIPADCRLIVVFDPKTDFTSGGYLSGEETSELKKLDVFLDAANSLMVFAGAETPSLPNFEEFLADWGIAFERYRDPDDETIVLGNYQVISPKDSVDVNSTTVIGVYETGGTGATVTQEMTSTGSAPKVVFGNAMPIRYSASYEQAYQMADSEKGTAAFTYGSYGKNAHYRNIYSLFYSSGAARGTYAHAVNGTTVLTDAAEAEIVDPAGSFKLATMTVESRTVSEGKGYTTVNDATYVCAFSSVEFASNDLLGSNAYGNTDLLLQVLRSIGREVVPVGLSFEPMYSSEIDANSSLEEGYAERTNTVTTIILTLIPALVCTVAGIWVLVRRRYAG